MELNEAFKATFNEDQIEAAISSMKDNRQEAGERLLEKLKSRIGDLKTNQVEIERFDPAFTKTLRLLAMLDIKDAFPYLVELLQFDQCCELIPPNELVSCLAALISDEDDVQVLKSDIVERTICSFGRSVACNAVWSYYKRVNEDQKLKMFLADIVSSFNQSNLENFEDFELAFFITEYSIKLRCGNLQEKIKELLIQLIVHSRSGCNASWFENYWVYLYRLDPLIAAKIHNSELYIQGLRYCEDEGLFQCESFADVGRFLYAKTLGNVEGATPDIVRLAIKKMRQYPYNDRIQPCSDEEYYKETCAYLGLEKLPREIFKQAEKYYQDIFKTGYPGLNEQIESLKEKTKIEIKKIGKDSDLVVSQSNSDHSVLKVMDDDIHRLTQNEIRARELNCLYRVGPAGDVGMLEFYRKQMESFFDSFCGDFNDQEKANKKLREISSRCAFSDTITIEDYFSPYQRVLQQMDLLLAEGPVPVLQNIFYNVKFVSFAEKITGNYRNTISAAKENQRDAIVDQMQSAVKKHPLYPVTLAACAEKSLKDYADTLERFSAETIESIKKVLKDSICLKKRKLIIEHCLNLIENEEDELAINLLPVQMEGLFADLLEYTDIYKYIDDIKRYRSMLNLELVEKIEFDRNINVPFNAVAYFKYYFSSVIRNTVAHGNYFLLIESSGIHGEHWKENENRGIIRRILALELLLDLNYLVNVIAEINEIDTAKKYIEDTVEQCSSMAQQETREDLYNCLFDDLNGTRDRFNRTKYKFGIFVTYDAMQIFFWIFSPFYGKYLNADHLRIVQDAVCSVEFWEYAKKRAGKPWNIERKKGQLCFIIRKMLSMQKELMQRGLVEQKTVDLMKEIKQLLSKYQC